MDPGIPERGTSPMAVTLQQLLAPEVISKVIGRFKSDKERLRVWQSSIHMNLFALRKKIKKDGVDWIKDWNLILTKAALDWLVKKYPEVGEPLLLNKIAGETVVDNAVYRKAGDGPSIGDSYFIKER